MNHEKEYYFLMTAKKNDNPLKLTPKNINDSTVVKNLL